VAGAGGEASGKQRQPKHESQPPSARATTQVGSGAFFCDRCATRALRTADVVHESCLGDAHCADSATSRSETIGVSLLGAFGVSVSGPASCVHAAELVSKPTASQLSVASGGVSDCSAPLTVAPSQSGLRATRTSQWRGSQTLWSATSLPDGSHAEVRGQPAAARKTHMREN
jgi:hypothetical protein